MFRVSELNVKVSPSEYLFIAAVARTTVRTVTLPNLLLFV